MPEDDVELPEVQALLDKGRCPLETEYGVVPGRVVYCGQPAHPGNTWCVEHLEMYGYPVK